MLSGTRRLLLDAIGPSRAEFQRWFRRADLAPRQLDLVVIAVAAKTYRERHGAWPADGAALAADGLLTDAEQRRTGAAVRLAPTEDGALGVGLKVQRISESEPERVISVRVAL
jgi:hypothetical protein